LLDETQVPYGYTYFHWETEKGIIEETGEEIEVQFCECNNCGYSFEPDGDDDPWVIEREKKEWPDVIG
jgi:predicted Zn-ribbon and HTH transcriptional regulator